MQIARLEAQIKRDMRMLRLEMECRIRRRAIACSRRHHDPVHVLAHGYGVRMHVINDGNVEDVSGELVTILTQLARLRSAWGVKVMPVFHARYVDGEPCSF